MQTQKIREKLMKLPSAPVIFSKIRAVFQSTRSFSIGFEQAEGVTSYERAKEGKAHQFEVERLKAMAAAYAQDSRLRQA